VLLGTNSTWEHYNGFVDSTVDLDEPQGGLNADGSYVQDFLAADSQSHTIGSLVFGPDGALYVSNGDGASYNAVDPRAIRVQDIDSLSGKVLRIDPLTGAGLADNPFFDGDADSNRSKVFQYGLRNPFRMSFDSTGQLFVGDVGWTQWEEINAGVAGANFGWPFYEGGSGGNVQTPLYSQLPEAAAFYASNQNVSAPLIGLDHVEDAIDAVIIGDVYSGGEFPTEYDGNLLFSHLASGHVRAVEFAEDGSIVEIKTLIQGPPFMTQLSVGPDGFLYFMDFGSGQIGRWLLN
jgi:glucose/arabinose dehydrogenase